MQRRTALISAGSLAAAALAGATAVGANIGILSAAGASPVGQLSAATEVQTSVQTAIVAVEDSQQFTVDAAGTVAIESTGDALRLGEVTANPGWTWSSSQPSETELRVVFDNTNSSFEFLAVLDSAGNLTARVDQPVVGTVAGTATTGYSDDDEGHGAPGDFEAYEGHDDDD